MRARGVLTSLNLSDSSLLFVKNHPLMEGVVTPISGKPLLVQASTQFSKILVDQVTTLDGQQRQIMFIGTGMQLRTYIHTNGTRHLFCGEGFNQRDFTGTEEMLSM